MTIGRGVRTGGGVVARTVAHGRHDGPLLGIAATGRVIAADKVVFARVAENRIVELREVLDTGQVLRQLGALGEWQLIPGIVMGAGPQVAPEG